MPATVSASSPARVAKSKTLATWLALLGGSLGLHRFYLHGPRDALGWLMPWPTLIGLAGVVRMRNLGQDDTTAWLLIPVLGLMLSVAMLTAIVYGLTPDEKWAARFGGGAVQRTSWGPVLGAIAALLVGGGVLMGTLAFGGQKFFEYQQLQQQAAEARAPGAAAADTPASR